MHILVSLLALLLVGPALAQEATLRYLGNEGVFVTKGDAKVLFDPLYENAFDRYQLVPDNIRRDIFDGAPPYDGIDAVFVSHHHGDHFSAADMLRLMRAHEDLRFYGPIQATSAVRAIAETGDEAVLERITGLDLDVGESPVRIETGDIVIEAVRVPHSGWPTRMMDVENIAFRVTLHHAATVLHLGDADARAVHFEADEDWWEEVRIDVAMPPYWFLASEDGVEILENRLNVGHVIGIHVPTDFGDPENMPPEYIGQDLFVTPGEGRRF